MRREFERALDAGATLVGVNNRDLRSFAGRPRDDRAARARLSPPASRSLERAASPTPRDVERLARAGVHAVLVGESLMRAARSRPRLCGRSCCHECEPSIVAARQDLWNPRAGTRARWRLRQEPTVGVVFYPKSIVTYLWIRREPSPTRRMPSDAVGRVNIVGLFVNADADDDERDRRRGRTGPRSTLGRRDARDLPALTRPVIRHGADALRKGVTRIRAFGSGSRRALGGA